MKALFLSSVTRLTELRNDVRGVTALEYGLIAAVVGTVIAVGFSSYGTRLSNAFGSLVV